MIENQYATSLGSLCKQILIICFILQFITCIYCICNQCYNINTYIRKFCKMGSVKSQSVLYWKPCERPDEVQTGPENVHRLQQERGGWWRKAPSVLAGPGQACWNAVFFSLLVSLAPSVHLKLLFIAFCLQGSHPSQWMRQRAIFGPRQMKKEWHSHQGSGLSFLSFLNLE